MNEIRKHQLGHMVIYKAMFKVAKNNNIKIFAYCGTMLGIERHKGFIPWDDDIDVAIWNGEYEKFIGALEKELPKRFRISRRSTRWGDKNDEAIVEDLESIVFKDKEHKKQRYYCVDIFRFGFLKPKVKKVPFARNFWRGMQFVGNSGTRSFGARFASWMVRHLFTGKYVHNKVNKLDTKISTQKASESLLAYDLGDAWNKAFDSKTFKKIEIRDLEGMPIWMPVNPDPFLTSNYGNWKKPVKWNDKLHYF